MEYLIIAKYYVKHRTGRNSLYKKESFVVDDKSEIQKIISQNKRNFSKLLGVEVVCDYTTKAVSTDDTKNQYNDSEPSEPSEPSESTLIDKVKLGIIESKDLQAKEAVDVMNELDEIPDSFISYNEERKTVIKHYEQTKNK